MRLLVTGGAGFVGSTFVRSSLAREDGTEILVLDSLTYAGNLENLGPVANSTGFAFQLADIRDAPAVRKAFRQFRPDIVVHCAAESHVDRSILVPADCVATNMQGTAVLLEAARELLRCSNRPGRILTVFGCGGDRDRSKRPVMGEIAGRLSDLVILTSDNPRSENPLNIINDIRVGLGRVESKHEIEADRAAAIRRAVSQGQAGDIVLLAGKGHETTQTIGGEVISFDDRETVRGVLHELGYGVHSVAG